MCEMCDVCDVRCVSERKHNEQCAIGKRVTLGE